jgi:hypothetical protein
LFDAHGRPAQRRAPTSSGRRGFTGSGWTASQWSFARSIIQGYVSDAYVDLDSWTRYELMRKSRWIKKNVGMVRGLSKAIVNHAVGPGIFIIPNTSDDNWNEAAWDYVTKRANSKFTDVACRMTLWDKQRVGTDHKFYDGECFTLPLRDSAGEPKFQVIRAHNCGNFDVDPDPAAGWYDGIQVNSQLKPLNYRFRLRNGQAVTIPARSVIHNYRMENADDVHGITALGACIDDIHDIVDTLRLTKDTIKEIARRGIVIKTESGESEDANGDEYFDTASGGAPDPTKADDTQRDTLPMEAVFGGGEILRLRKDESLDVVNENRPSPAFTGFLDFLGRGASTGADVPYEFAWDRKGLNGPAQRSMLEQANAGFRSWADCEGRDTYALYTHWISCGIDNGDLKARPDQFDAEILRGAPDVTIDRGRDARADIEFLKAGLDTFKRQYASRGLYWKREIRQKAEEARFIMEQATKAGVSPDWIHQLTANNTGNNANDAAASDRADAQTQT